MKRHLLGITFLAAAVCPLWAGEHVVEAAEIEKAIALEGTLLPQGGIPFRLEPEEWASYPVKEVVPQGALVKKGASVVVLDTEALDRLLGDEKEAKRIRDLDLAAAKRSLTDAEVQTPRALDASKRALQRVKDDVAYFKAIGKSEKTKASKRSVTRAERALEYQSEELGQLLKMYKEDDLTEETEEIILKRQRTFVDDAEIGLARTRLASQRYLDVEIIREEEDLAVKLKDAELDWSTQKEALPRALRKQQLEIKKMIETHQRADKRLADLRKDRAAMGLKASVAGRLYYGEFTDGHWSPGTTAKYLKRGGSIPTKTNFATLIPEGAELHVQATATEAQVRSLKVGQKGYFAPTSAPRQRLVAELRSVASHPNLAGTYPVEIKLSGGSADFVTGMKGKAHLIALSQEDALTVPVSALIEKNDGSFAVKVKEAGEEGETEERTVELGQEFQGKIVVTSGLAAGEVVLTTEPKK
jgi:HlyD family secretion protein